MSASIADIVAITGQPGLHKVLKTNDTAIVVESLDGKAKRQLIKGNMMVSKLTDVSIYTEEDSEPLVKVMQRMQETYGADLPVNKNSKNEELLAFLGEVLPAFDSERVYASNVKKLLGWYEILLREGVELVLEEEESPVGEAAASEEVADAEAKDSDEAAAEEQDDEAADDTAEKA